MAQEFADASEWQQALLLGRPFLDVRAEVEFAQGSLPGAFNLPILNDEERHLVGTCYKQQGPKAAVELGHQLISGEIRQGRIEGWVSWLRKNPEALLYCFRGGQRSAIAQQWILESGIPVRRIPGGYKQVRRFLLETITTACRSLPLRVIAGRTGSGKTRLLRRTLSQAMSQAMSQVQAQAAIIDLEALARHRGSAFGGELEPQPSQADFENRLAADLMRVRQASVWIEDESRSIGQVLLPAELYQKMAEAPVYVIEEPISERAKNILQEYVIDAFEKRSKRLGALDALTDLGNSLRESIMRLSRRLGGVRTEQALSLLDSALKDSASSPSHLAWIEFLLREYYDPIYSRQLEEKSSRVVFRGSSSELWTVMNSE